MNTKRTSAVSRTDRVCYYRCVIGFSDSCVLQNICKGGWGKLFPSAASAIKQSTVVPSLFTLHKQSDSVYWIKPPPVPLAHPGGPML